LGRGIVRLRRFNAGGGPEGTGRWGTTRGDR
jgi:hypothetical protein